MSATRKGPRDPDTNTVINTVAKQKIFPRRKGITLFINWRFVVRWGGIIEGGTLFFFRLLYFGLWQ